MLGRGAEMSRPARTRASKTKAAKIMANWRSEICIGVFLARMRNCRQRLPPPPDEQSFWCYFLMANGEGFVTIVGESDRLKPF